MDARSPEPDVEGAVGTIDWQRMAAGLDADGFAVHEGLLGRDTCERVAALYAKDDPFRSRVVMASHGFGLGEYRYFAYPLPALVAELRARLYPPLAEIANRWSAALGLGVEFPLEHAAFLSRCHAADQRRPTPLLLAYRRRLQLPAPGSLRRARLPAPGRDPSGRAPTRLHRRRAGAHRAAATHAVPRTGGAGRAGRRGRVRRPPPPGRRASAASTAWRCDTASAASAPAAATPWVSSSTTRSDRDRTPPLYSPA